MFVKFVDQTPDTQMLVPFENTVTVQVTGNGGNQIAWSALPRYALGGNTASGYAQVANGIATFTVVIDSKPKADNQNSVLISVWDPTEEDADHYTALFKCVAPRAQYSVSRTYAWNSNPKYDPLDTNNPNPLQILRAVIYLSDEDDGSPINKCQVRWRARSARPGYVISENNTILSPDDNGYFSTLTGRDGRTELKFADTNPSVYAMVCYYGYSALSMGLIFSALNTGWGKPEMDPPIIANPLDLDDWPDSTSIPVVIPPSNWFKEGDAAEGAFWLNGFMLPMQQIIAGKPLPVPKHYFVSGDRTPATNKSGYIVANGTNGHECAVYAVAVSGKIPVDKPKDPTPSISRLLPTLSANVAVVDSAAISGGLEVFVPPSYTLYRMGDVIIMRLYLKGYFPGTESARTNVLASTTYAISPDEFLTGFSFIFSESRLYGYAGPGTIAAQFEVLRGGTSLYSGVLTLPLQTAS